MPVKNTEIHVFDINKQKYTMEKALIIPATNLFMPKQCGDDAGRASSTTFPLIKNLVISYNKVSKKVNKKLNLLS